MPVRNTQTPKSGIPPNIAPKIVTPENYLQIWGSSATLIGQLAIVTLFGAILGGIPLSGTYPFHYVLENGMSAFKKCVSIRSSVPHVGFSSDNDGLFASNRV